MYIGLPERKLMSKAEGRFLILGSCLLFTSFELLIGASLPFAMLMGLFLWLTIETIRALGGLGTIFGAAMATYAFQHIIASQILKFSMGQAPETRLDAPIETMMAYCAGGLSLLAGAYLSKYFAFRGGRPFFPPLTDPKRLAAMAVVASVLQIIRAAVSQSIFEDQHVTATGGVYGLIGQMNVLETMGVVCATASVVIASGGRKLVGWLTAFAMALPVVLGVTGGHRAGLIIPFFMILLTGWAFGYRYRIKHVALITAGAWFFLFVVSPAALAVRNTARTGNFVRDLTTSLSAIGDQTSTVAGGERETGLTDKTTPEVYATRYLGSYDYDLTTVTERFSLIKATDAIVNVTLHEGPTEMTTITPGFLMALPSFIYPDKPTTGTSNMIAHRVPGWVGPGDYETQITFGIVADSFGAYEWAGALLIPGAILFAWSVMQKLFVRLEFKGNVYALGLTAHILMYYAAGTIQSGIGYTLQLVFIQALGLALVHHLAKFGDLSYLHPQNRRRTIARTAIPE